MVLNGLDKSVFVNQKIIDMEISGRARTLLWLLLSGSCSRSLWWLEYWQSAQIVLGLQDEVRLAERIKLLGRHKTYFIFERSKRD